MSRIKNLGPKSSQTSDIAGPHSELHFGLRCDEGKPVTDLGRFSEK